MFNTDTIAIGLAIASIWFWIDVIRKEYRNMKTVLFWLAVVVPQAVIVAYALQRIGVIKCQ